MAAIELSLHHIQLAIPPGSEDSCREFYIGIIGMTEIAKPAELVANGGLWLQSGGLQIHLGVEADFIPAKKAHPGILVEGLDDLVATLASHDIKIMWDDKFPGYRRFYTFDTIGNRLEFLAPE
jgi:catechol 2,3-dioxygenase-like lactoylglutathione lyase family enzyme